MVAFAGNSILNRLALAFVGLGYLLWPAEANTLPLWGSGLMFVAGFGSGVYSLLGAKVSDPLAETAVNFGWASPVAILVFILRPDQISSHGVFEEALTPRFAVACVLVLGGIALGLRAGTSRTERVVQ